MGTTEMETPVESFERVADISHTGASGNAKLSVLDGGQCVTFGIDVREPGNRTSLGVQLTPSQIMDIRDMLNKVIERNTTDESDTSNPYRPHTHPALVLENWGVGPAEMLLTDEGDSVSYSTTVTIEGVSVVTEVRLSPDNVNAMQKRLAEIREYRGW